MRLFEPIALANISYRFRRPAVAGARHVTAFGIASVYTHPSQRKKGYATKMLQLLHWVLAPLPIDTFPSEWGVPPTRPENRGFGEAAFSVLYSDVGPDIYAACGPRPGEPGWVVQNPTSTVWDVDRILQTVDSTKDTESDLTWTWLDDKQLLDAWKVDAERFIAESFSNPSAVNCAFLPDQGVAQFQIDRTKEWWSRLNPPPTHWGLEVSSKSDTAKSTISFSAWTLEVRAEAAKDKKMLITRLYFPSGPGSDGIFPQILAKWAQVASQFGISQIEVWNLPTHLVESQAVVETGGRTFERSDHLSSFIWYGQDPNEKENVRWIHNEK